MCAEVTKTESLNAMSRLLGKLIEVLSKKSGISEDTLKRIHRELNHKTVVGRFPSHVPHTWDLVLFKGNARKYASLPGSKVKEFSKITSLRIGHIANVIRMLGWAIDEVEYNDPSTWPRFIEHLIARIQSDTEEAPAYPAMETKALGVGISESSSQSEDLHSVGDNSKGLDRFTKICKDATSIYNTVFTRNEPPFVYLRRELESFEAALKTLLDEGCVWNEIVSHGEADDIREFYKSLTRVQRRSYHPRKLSSTVKVPLLQCVVMRWNERRSAVLIGWSFSGTHTSRVYFSDHTHTCDYFYAYCKTLFENHCTEFIVAPRARGVKLRGAARKSRIKQSIKSTGTRPSRLKGRR